MRRCPNGGETGAVQDGDVGRRVGGDTAKGGVKLMLIDIKKARSRTSSCCQKQMEELSVCESGCTGCAKAQVLGRIAVLQFCCS